jgi:hypothetical protein
MSVCLLLLMVVYPPSPEGYKLPLIIRSKSYKYGSGHYPSSCLYLKIPFCLYYKTQHFRDWILCLSSGKTYSVPIGTSCINWAQLSRFWRLDSVSSSGKTCSVPVGSSSIDWAQLSRFYPKTETESSLWNVVFWNINVTVFLDKDRTMDSAQKHNICTICYYVECEVLPAVTVKSTQHSEEYTTSFFRVEE